MKKALTSIFILFLLLTSVSLGEDEAMKATITKNVKPEKPKNKTIATIKTEFNIDKELPEYIEFETKEDIKPTQGVKIPSNSKVRAKVIQFQTSRRWHRSGYIVTKLIDYETQGETINLEDKDSYLVIRKYEKVDKKEASILATEIIVTQGASIFAPGVDIAYFFTKGAIKGAKHPNRFKAGVINAYDNSLLWFGLKGKPVNLNADDQIKVEYINEEIAREMKAKMDYRHHKQDFKKEKRLVKAEIKNIKADCKREKRVQKYLAKHQKEFDKMKEEYLATLKTMHEINQKKEIEDMKPAAKINLEDKDKDKAKTKAKKNKTKK